MSVSWYICDCQDVARFSNESFKELIKELKKSGVKFSRMELNVPYYEGYWGPEFCEEVLEALVEVSDKLIAKDTGWIESLPDIVNALKRAIMSDEFIKIG